MLLVKNNLEEAQAQFYKGMTLAANKNAEFLRRNAEAWLVTNNKNTIIAASNTALTGDSQTIYFAATNTPAAIFPIMQESTDIWSFVHDFDDSENNEWSDGIEEDSILKSNMGINPGEKIHTLENVKKIHQ